jgi:hypothetical protein
MSHGDGPLPSEQSALGGRAQRSPGADPRPGRARLEHDERALLDRLSLFATEVRVDPPGSERVALNAQLLVRRDRRSALDDAVAVLAALQSHLALRYLGPPPPYSFADLSLEAGG